jgi:hypothetical protein
VPDQNSPQEIAMSARTRFLTLATAAGLLAGGAFGVVAYAADAPASPLGAGLNPARVSTWTSATPHATDDRRLPGVVRIDDSPRTSATSNPTHDLGDDKGGLRTDDDSATHRSSDDSATHRSTDDSATHRSSHATATHRASDDSPTHHSTTSTHSTATTTAPTTTATATADDHGGRNGNSGSGNSGSGSSGHASDDAPNHG